MMIEAVITDDLPAAFSREIGRIVVKFARLEHKLSAAIYVVLQLHRVEGRLAVREPRLPERVDLVRELLDLREIKVATDFKALRSAIEDATNNRDQIAHGIWVRDSKKYYLRRTKGHWPTDQQVDGRKKRIVLPEGVPFEVEGFREVLTLIETAIKGVDHLGGEIDHALATSPEKFQSLLYSTNPLLGNRPIKPQDPRRSSQK